ncbi:MAG: tyrosine-type recombinase/integrase [Spirochaetia bacterium]|jgi:integrase
MAKTAITKAHPAPALAKALLEVKGAGELTTAAYRTALRAFLESAHPPTVEGFAAYIHGLRRTRSAATVNQALAAGRKAFLQAAERLGLPAKEISLIRGALGEIPAVKKAPPEVTVVSPEERAKLLGALPLRIRLVAETLYVTGARVSEILGTRRDQVRINGTVELRLYGKGGKERNSRIPAELYRRILAEFPEGIYLFSSYKGQHFHREYISREIARAARRVLGRSISAHVLRHSRATDLLASTHRIKAVSRLLGHSDEATTLRYYVHDAFSDEELFGGM